MQKEYNLTIFRQSRIITCLFSLPVFLFLTLFIGTESHSLIIPSIFFLFVIFTMYYFSVGNLNIIIDENKMCFTWKKKFLFNYKSIPSIEINDITTIILDEYQFLRKIKTSTRTIFINNSKINAKNADLFISRLKNDANFHNIRIIDSWDEFSEKGYLRKAYVINSGLLIISIIIVTLLTFTKGFSPYSLSIFALVIPQILLYSKQAKSNINN